MSALSNKPLDFFTFKLIAFGCVWNSQYNGEKYGRKDKATICISCGVNLIERVMLDSRATMWK